MNAQTDFAALVNIAKQKWPSRHRTYFGSLEVRSPQPGEGYLDNSCGDCGGSFYAAAVNDLRCGIGAYRSTPGGFQPYAFCILIL